ncbi:hypothetical protein Tco_0971475 [Tanacetum coccineum]
MVELEHVKKMSKKDLLRLDKELAFKLQAEEEEEAKIEADYQLAQRLQAQEQEELTDEEKARLFVQFLEQRRKHFAAKRAEEKRNIPPIRAQQRSIMIELVKESSKKVETELKENLKKAEAEVMKGNEEEVAIDVIPLATKPPTIVYWKIYKEGKNNYYQIIRADESSKMYRVFSQMLKSFDRKNLEDLYKLVKAKYGSTRPVEDLDLILYGDLKTMFDPHVEDIVWRNQQDYRVLDWKIYDSCRVHSLRMQHVYIHMLVEKRCPLTPATITDMLNKKLHYDHLSEMGRIIVGIKRLLDDLRVTAAQVCVTAAKLKLGCWKYWIVASSIVFSTGVIGYLVEMSNKINVFKLTNSENDQYVKRRNNYAQALIEVSLENILVDSLVVAILFQNESGHTMETIDIEYEWQPPRCDTCKNFDHKDEQCPKKVKVDALTKVSDDGFVKVTRKHRNGKQTAKTRHIDGVWLTKPKPNYYYHPSSKSANVNSEASTSQPKEKKEPSPPNETWKASNDVGSIMDDSDTKQVEKHVKDNRKPMDGLVDDARKKLEAPPKKTPRKIGIVLVDGSVPEPSVSQ